MSQGNPPFRPLKESGGWGIQPIGHPPGLDKGDVHETFKVDEIGRISGGHTTVRLPGGYDIRLPWNNGHA